jgi:hypothetical protein
MSVTLERPAEVAQPPVVKGGLLDVALPAPSGWERGLTIEFYGCGEPILRDKCISGTDVPHRGGIATFPIFPIEQGATCSTLGGGDQQAHASARLEATTEWAVGRQLATDIVGTGAPSFADADVLGTVADADFVTAVGCLEQAAADAGFGTQWFLHAPVRAASYLAYLGQVDTNNLSGTGAKWIFSPGYPVQASTTIRLWATGPVWVGVGDGISNPDTDWRTNSKSAFALRAGLVAFDPCINIAIDVTVPACP